MRASLAVLAVSLATAGPASAAGLPQMIGKIPDPGRAADGTPSAEWINGVYEPRCTAVRIAELEQLCKGIEHEHCDRLAMKLEANGYTADIMQVVDVFRGYHAGTETAAAGALFAADLRSCEGYKLDIAQ